MAMAKRVKKGDVKAFSDVSDRPEGRAPSRLIQKTKVTQALTQDKIQRAREVVKRLRTIDGQSDAVEGIAENRRKTRGGIGYATPC